MYTASTTEHAANTTNILIKFLSILIGIGISVVRSAAEPDNRETPVKVKTSRDSIPSSISAIRCVAAYAGWAIRRGGETNF